MSTITWTEVIDTTTGRVYADCDEVERRHGVPAVLVGACIQTGKAINGHCFDLMVRHASSTPCGHVPNANSTQREERLRKKREHEKRRLERERAGLVRPPLTDELKAQCVKRYEAGVPVVDIGRAIGRQIGRRELKRWAAELERKRRENPSCATVDGPEGAESGDSSPA